jgi:dolichol kinase
MALQLTNSVFVLVLVLIFVAYVIIKLNGTKKDAKELKSILKNAFLIRIERIKRVTFELQRKAFHIAGLIIPSAYIAALQSGLLTRHQSAMILGALAGAQILLETGRQISPTFNKMVVSVMRSTMRPEELKEVKVTGTPFFLSGNFLVVWLFEPTVAVVSQLFLVVGDLMAALVGIAYGRHTIYKNKSLEGFLGCFFSCVVAGILIFSWATPLLTWTQQLILVTVGGFVASVVELVSGDGLFNDNLTIPFASGFTIHWLAKLLGAPLLGEGVRLNYY